MSDIVLTSEQEKAVTMVVDRINTSTPMTRLGGFAGTGKSLCIKKIIERLNKSMAVCAYTGKAASVLRQKGVQDAKTIHSTIYKPREEVVRGPDGRDRLVVRWGLIGRDELAAEGFIIDEASMVGKEILDDLMSFGLPIIAVGDPGQLPPISKNDVNLMDRPDFTMTEIHRQAADSEIIRLATRIRTEYNFLYTLTEYEGAGLVIAPKCNVRNTADADVFVCGFNRTRAALNDGARRRKNYVDLLVPGEQIIALANDRDLRVFNGLMGIVKEIGETIDTTIYPRGEDPKPVKKITAKVLWDGESEPRETNFSSYAFGGTATDWNTNSAHMGHLVVDDYGYALTCHKSQGSQWNKVVVLNEQAPKLWDQRRWAYTAVTRAARELVLGVDGL